MLAASPDLQNDVSGSQRLAGDWPAAQILSGCPISRHNGPAARACRGLCTLEDCEPVSWERPGRRCCAGGPSVRLTRLPSWFGSQPLVKQEVWLRTNRRAMFLAMWLPGFVAAIGAVLAWNGEGFLRGAGLLIVAVGGGLVL